MHQEAVRNAGKLLKGLLIVLDDRTIGKVRACHHQDPRPCLKQQDMQRCIRKHDPYIGIIGDPCRQLLPLADKGNRLRRALHEPGLFLGNLRDLSCRFQVPAHESKGLFLSLLAPSELRNPGSPVRSHGQVKASQSFDRQDPA